MGNSQSRKGNDASSPIEEEDIFITFEVGVWVWEQDKTSASERYVCGGCVTVVWHMMMCSMWFSVCFRHNCRDGCDA